MTILTIIGWVLSFATALFLGKGAIDKIRGTQEMVGNFAYMKLENYRILTGCGELLGAILLLIPQTSIIGALLISCFMSGALVMHLSAMGGAKKEIPILVGVASILGYMLTHIS